MITIALDWPSNNNDHVRLMETLNSLQDDEQFLFTLPIILVTPSASGYSMVDWIVRGNVALLSNYVSTWVPVATGSLPLASDDQVTSIMEYEPMTFVLAIHGNDDMAGARYSARLERLANATVVELMGGHAVYLQSPVDFVDTILAVAL